MAKKKLAILISPNVHAAYFQDYLSVCEAELSFCLDIKKWKSEYIGGLHFILINFKKDELSIHQVLTLSFVMGVFYKEDEQFKPLDVSPNLKLHRDFIFGSKYKGKTNEHLTQLLLNIALKATKEKEITNIKVLDPMCGRGTSLMWSLNYGLNCKGIEYDTQALLDIRQHLKKWSKLHRQKHKIKEGFTHKSNRSNDGKFLEYSVLTKDKTVTQSAQFISGDAREAKKLLNAERFDIIMSDLPYGIQHQTQDGKRNPLETLNECALNWKKCLKPGGVIVLSFNRYIPKREAMIDAFTNTGLCLVDFQAPHRMSESIVRDIVVFKLHS